MVERKEKPQLRCAYVDCPNPYKSGNTRIFTFDKDRNTVMLCCPAHAYNYLMNTKESAIEWWWLLGKKLVNGAYKSREEAIKGAFDKNLKYIYASENLQLLGIIRHPVKFEGGKIIGVVNGKNKRRKNGGN